MATTRNDPHNDNLFAALRAGFPDDLDRMAIETETGLVYTWRDLDRGSAMLANLLASLDIPAGSRVAAHMDKSVEATRESVGISVAIFSNSRARSPGT